MEISKFKEYLSIVSHKLVGIYDILENNTNSANEKYFELNESVHQVFEEFELNYIAQESNNLDVLIYYYLRKLDEVNIFHEYYLNQTIDEVLYLTGAKLSFNNKEFGTLKKSIYIHQEYIKSSLNLLLDIIEEYLTEIKYTSKLNFNYESKKIVALNYKIKNSNLSIINDDSNLNRTITIPDSNYSRRKKVIPVIYWESDHNESEDKILNDIKNLFNHLIKYSLISSNSDFNSFYKFFIDNKNTVDKKIDWLIDAKSLVYFFYRLKTCGAITYESLYYTTISNSFTIRDKKIDISIESWHQYNSLAKKGLKNGTIEDKINKITNLF